MTYMKEALLEAALFVLCTSLVIGAATAPDVARESERTVEVAQAELLSDMLAQAPVEQRDDVERWVECASNTARARLVAARLGDEDARVARTREAMLHQMSRCGAPATAANAG
jgi:hypothetical protein